MKKLLSIVIILLLLTGCSLFQKKIPLNKPEYANCNVIDCIRQLDTKMDLNKVNEVIGFEGELVKETTISKTYKWGFNKEKNEELQATFYSKDTAISITFDDNDIKNSRIDFSKYEEIRKALKDKKTLKYEDIKSRFKAEGVLIEKTSSTTKYRWVKEKGKYLNATFNNKLGACIMIIGMI